MNIIITKITESSKTEGLSLLKMKSSTETALGIQENIYYMWVMDTPLTEGSEIEINPSNYEVVKKDVTIEGKDMTLKYLAYKDF